MRHVKMPALSGHECIGNDALASREKTDGAYIHVFGGGNCLVRVLLAEHFRSPWHGCLDNQKPPSRWIEKKDDTTAFAAHLRHECIQAFLIDDLEHPACVSGPLARLLLARGELLRDRCF
jgi:hypothetical protein